MSTTVKARKWEDVKARRPITDAEAAAGRAKVDAEVAAYRLAEIRNHLHRTQTDVADAMGTDQRRVSRIELADIDRTQVSTLAAYAAALGGRLRIEVEVDGELIPLR